MATMSSLSPEEATPCDTNYIAEEGEREGERE